MQAVRDVQFAGIDFLSARLFLDYLHPAVKTGSGAGLMAAPDASRVYSLWAESYAGNHCLMAHAVTPTAITLLHAVFVDPSQAMGIGPDPNHIMLVTSQAPEHLIVMRGADGSVVDHYDIPVAHSPEAIANSHDGRFVVVVGQGDMVTLSGADIRGLMAPSFDIEEADVRTHEVALGIDSMGTCLHPSKDVAYAWAPNGSNLKVVCIGLPNV